MPRRASWGIDPSRTIRVAKPAASRGAKVQPFSPSRTSVCAAPHPRLTRTGSPAAIPSFTTNPQGSLSLGTIRASARP